MKAFTLAAFFSILFLVSPALALNISVSTDKTQLPMGDTFLLSGKITYDNGTPDVFTYRAVTVAPRRVIICDSHIANTSSDGSFSLTCTTPDRSKANSLGIPAASTRELIPLRSGVLVIDPTRLIIVKKYANTIFAIDTKLLKKRILSIADDIDKFVKNIDNVVKQCDNLSDKALKYNLTNIADRCTAVKVNITKLASDASNVSANARQLGANINSINLRDFRDNVGLINKDMQLTRNELARIGQIINGIRWETLKEIQKADQDKLKQAQELKRRQLEKQRQDQLNDRRERLRRSLGKEI